MKYLFLVMTVVLIGVFAVIGFAYSGLHDVSAGSRHSDAFHWLLTTTRQASVERRAGQIDVPNLDDEKLRLAGVNDYAAMCAGCHGAPGQKPEAAGLGLYPSPPDLAESAARMTPAELFWVTKNGIKMTGMPAWGVTHDDEALWPVVALLIALPGLDAADYQSLLLRAEGMGHHAISREHSEADAMPGHDHEHRPAPDAEPSDQSTGAHDHASHSHSDPAPVDEKDTEDDGRDHEH